MIYGLIFKLCHKSANTIARKKRVMFEFIPARLVDSGKYWYITYHATNPITKKIERYRVSNNLNRIKSKADKRKTAKLQVNQINNQLYNSINPFYPDIKQDDIKKIKSRRKKDTHLYDAAELAYEYILQRTNSRDSKRTYKSMQKQFINYLNNEKIATLPVSQFDTELAQMYLDQRFAKTSGRTANNTKRYLITLFAYLTKRGYIDRNPVLACDTYRNKITDKRGFTKHEIELIIPHLQETDKHLLLFCKMIYYLALRPKELINLQIAQIDFKNKKVCIRGEQIKSGVHIYYIRPIAEPLYEMLLPYEKHDKRLYLFAKGYCCGYDKRLTATPLNDRHHEMLKFLEIYEKGLSIYSWKDTAMERLTELLEKGNLKMKEISEHFGHTQISTTEKYLKRRSYGDNDKIRLIYPEL